MSSELGALLLGDARLPIGGHAYSAGLEPGLAAGMTTADVPGYIDARLRTVGLVEAAAAVLAQRTVAERPAELDDVQRALLARTPSAPLREISALLGRGLARLAAHLWPDHPAPATLAGLDSAPQRPIALGVVAAVMGVDERDTARASLYDDAQTVASAALKLAPVDPVDAVGWVLAAEPSIDALLERAVAVRGPDDLPACSAPQAEIWSLDQHHKTRRIFIA